MNMNRWMAYFIKTFTFLFVIWAFHFDSIFFFAFISIGCRFRCDWFEWESRQFNPFFSRASAPHLWLVMAPLPSSKRNKPNSMASTTMKQRHNESIRLYFLFHIYGSLRGWKHQYLIWVLFLFPVKIFIHFSYIRHDLTNYHIAGHNTQSCMRFYFSGNERKKKILLNSSIHYCCSMSELTALT